MIGLGGFKITSEPLEICPRASVMTLKPRDICYLVPY